MSVGIRAISKAEVEYYDANRDRIAIHWAKDQASWDIEEIVAPLGGTAGLRHVRHRCARCRGHAGDGYADARRARLSAVAGHRAARLRRWGNVVGADLVEFAPIAGLHACDYTAAALAYKLLSYALSPR